MNTNLIDFLKANPEQDFTIKTLARKFDIPETTIRNVIIPNYLERWKPGDMFLATTVKGVQMTIDEKKTIQSENWKTVRFKALGHRVKLERKIRKQMFPEPSLFETKFAGQII